MSSLRCVEEWLARVLLLSVWGQSNTLKSVRTTSLELLPSLSPPLLHLLCISLPSRMHHCPTHLAPSLLMSLACLWLCRSVALQLCGLVCNYSSTGCWAKDCSMQSLSERGPNGCPQPFMEGAEALRLCNYAYSSGFHLPELVFTRFSLSKNTVWQWLCIFTQIHSVLACTKKRSVCTST